MSLGSSRTHSICEEFCRGERWEGTGGLKSNEKDALSSQKTLNKQDEVIGTAACAPVMMAPLIGLQLTQLQAAPLNFHCSHFPSQCATHFHCFIIGIPHMLRICTRTYNIFWLAYLCKCTAVRNDILICRLCVFTNGGQCHLFN